jgi:hypothetical protein
MTNVCNWWCKIGPVTTDDINTIHEILGTKKKNREFNPTLSTKHTKRHKICDYCGISRKRQRG